MKINEVSIDMNSFIVCVTHGCSLILASSKSHYFQTKNKEFSTSNINKVSENETLYTEGLLVVSFLDFHHLNENLIISYQNMIRDHKFTKTVPAKCLQT